MGVYENWLNFGASLKWPRKELHFSVHFIFRRLPRVSNTGCCQIRSKMLIPTFRWLHLSSSNSAQSLLYTTLNNTICDECWKKRLLTSELHKTQLLKCTINVMLSHFSIAQFIPQRTSANLEQDKLFKSHFLAANVIKMWQNAKNELTVSLLKRVSPLSSSLTVM